MAGQSISLGIRPESIQVFEPGKSAGPKTKVKVAVGLVEPMGNEIYLYFTTRNKGSQFVVRVPSKKKLTVGKPLELLFDMTQAHYFYHQSEKAI